MTLAHGTGYGLQIAPAEMGVRYNVASETVAPVTLTADQQSYMNRLTPALRQVYRTTDTHVEGLLPPDHVGYPGQMVGLFRAEAGPADRDFTGRWRLEIGDRAAGTKQRVLVEGRPGEDGAETFTLSELTDEGEVGAFLSQEQTDRVMTIFETMAAPYRILDERRPRRSLAQRMGSVVRRLVDPV